MGWLQWLLSFIGVIGLILLLFYALKKLNKRVSVSAGGKLKVLERVGIGRDGMLLVISIDGKLMLIGATAQRIEKLCDLDLTEEDYLSGQQSVDFKTILANLRSKTPQQGENPDEGTSETSDKTE